MRPSTRAVERVYPQRAVWGRLSDVIRSRGWKQTDAALFFGVTQPTISEWMRGRNAPHFGLWPKLAALLGLTIPELGAEIGVIFFTQAEKVFFYNPNLEKNK